MFDRDVNRTVYGYGRTPYGEYTGQDRCMVRVAFKNKKKTPVTDLTTMHTRHESII